MRQDLKLKFTKEFLDQELQTKYIRQIAAENSTDTNTVYNYVRKLGLNVPPKSKREFQKIKHKRFGKLIVKSYAGVDKFGKTLVECLCDCGQLTILNKSSLIRDLTLSCGCIKKNKCRQGGCGDVSRTYFTKLQQSAIDRNIEFNITIQDVWDVLNNQNGKCVISGLDICFYPDYNKQKHQTASVDRINPDKGYIKDNIQIVHKRVNILKGNMTEDELKYWIYHIYNRLNPSDSFIGTHTDISASYKDRNNEN